MARRKQTNSKKRGKKQRNRRKPAPRKNEELRGLLEWFLGGNSIFSKMKLHGNAKWVPERLEVHTRTCMPVVGGKVLELVI